MKFIISWLPIYFPNAAGRLSFGWRGFSFHFLPKKDHVVYGLIESWYDGPFFELGFGPLLLVVWRHSLMDAIKGLE
jgi:hypothetical protein